MDFESRESNRVGSSSFLSFRLINAENQTFQEGVATTVDISKTGIALTTSNEVELNSRIELAIGVGDEVVKAKGTIRNQKKVSDKEYNIGVEFDFLSEEDLDKLATVFPDISR